jgi:hypothetical protein
MPRDSQSIPKFVLADLQAIYQKPENDWIDPQITSNATIQDRSANPAPP